MTSSRAKAKIVRVKIEQGKAGLFYATSMDLRGLLVAEPTLSDLEREIPAAIRDLFAAADTRVVVSRAESALGEYAAWVAFPAEVAERELEAAH